MTILILTAVAANVAAVAGLYHMFAKSCEAPGPIIEVHGS